LFAALVLALDTHWLDARRGLGRAMRHLGRSIRRCDVAIAIPPKGWRPGSRMRLDFWQRSRCFRALDDTNLYALERIARDCRAARGAVAQRAYRGAGPVIPGVFAVERRRLGARLQ